MSSTLFWINDYAVPAPARGLTYTMSTNVNAGRNANGEMIGQRVGRDLFKFDNVVWPWMTEQEWGSILDLTKDFYFRVRFQDPMTKVMGQIWCYCGDRTAEPYWMSHEYNRVLYFRNCKCNIIDAGWLNAPDQYVPWVDWV